MADAKKIAERPSERIEELFKELSTRHQRGLMEVAEGRLYLRMEAITQYLDERWERSQRRGKKR